MGSLLHSLEDIVDATYLPISSLSPSEWYESRMVMPSGSARPGPFSFDQTPYLREIVDCGGRDHPAREISFMKGAQLGGTAAVINAIIGYTISQNPGNSMLLTGHTELSDAAFLKVDAMIDACGLRSMIRPNIQRAKNSRTADTSSLKEFPSGNLVGGSVTNHNLLRQYDVMIMIVDDFDASKMFSKDAGSTRELVQQRTTAFAHKKKIFYVSSPQLKNQSNIESVFLKGDQRYYNVPCPCCHRKIVLKWEIKVLDKEPAGIVWKLDNHGNLDTKSVGYICQECGNFFNDSHKYEMNINGLWVPTVIPVEENHYSYQLSSLYSPAFMDGWAVIVQKYLNANPKNAAPIESKMQTFINVQLGETYEKLGRNNDSSELLKNIRNYAIGTVPDVLAKERDGNGKVVILTCAADLNGKENDARLDYEVVAWTETGASYSITHGSIGTFVYKEGEDKGDRAKWTYWHKKPNSVWPEFEKVLANVYKTQTGKQMKIVITGVDCGHFTNFAYAYIDKTNHNVIGLKGDKENQYRKFGIDVPIFKPAKERARLFLLDVNNIKDTISKTMELKWSPSDGEVQPVDFMNYPQPAGDKYMHHNYFKHYEAEQRIEDKKEGEGVASMWMKKQSNLQNHFWDCFDDQTQVLTTSGWKYFKDVTIFDDLGTVNLEKDTLEYQKPLALISKPFDGKMVHIDNKKVNICVTPSHRMVVYRKVKSKRSTLPEIIKASELRITDTIKLTFKWECKGDDYYTIPALYSHGRLVSAERKIKSSIWASFLGMYVSEGGRYKNWSNKRGSYAHVVKIFQNKGHKFDKMKEVMDALPFKYRVVKSTNTGFAFEITQKQLYQALEVNGNGVFYKKSGDWIKNQSSDVISKFIDFAMLGDGYQNNKQGGHRKYYTISVELADDIQELIIKTGKHSNIHEVIPPDENNKLQYHVSENKTQTAHLRRSDNKSLISEYDYSGTVYCATVPNGTLVCRRNKSVFVAGNCRVYNHALREIYADLTLRMNKPPMKGNWHDFVAYAKLYKKI